MSKPFKTISLSALLSWTLAVQIIGSLWFSHRAETPTALPPATVAIEYAGEEAWPERADDLPQGDPTSGESLFHGRLGCAACHGATNDSPSPPRLGPSLRGIADRASTRIHGVSAEQYLYEALLEPNRFIAPGCQAQTTCADPSVMPGYADFASYREVADVLAYLRSLTSTSAGRGAQ